MDAAKLEQLKTALRPAFEQHGVRLAYLFGSQATGRTHAESDTDIAVLLPEKLEPRERLSMRLDLVGEAMRACASDAVDVVDLAEASPLLLHQVVSEGIVLFCDSQQERSAFDARVRQGYEESRPLRRFRVQALRERVGARVAARKAMAA